MEKFIKVLLLASLFLSQSLSAGDGSEELRYVGNKMKESTVRLMTEKYLLLGRNAICVDRAVEVGNEGRVLYQAGRYAVEEFVYHIVSAGFQEFDGINFYMSIMKENIHHDHKASYRQLGTWISQLPWTLDKIQTSCGTIQDRVVFKVGVIDQIIDQRKFHLATDPRFGYRGPASQP